MSSAGVCKIYKMLGCESATALQKCPKTCGVCATTTTTTTTTMAATAGPESVAAEEKAQNATEGRFATVTTLRGSRGTLLIGLGKTVLRPSIFLCTPVF